jgi:NAD-dependent deacetylase
MDQPAALIENIIKAADLIRSARSTVVITGAGCSTPSGIPDFRSPHNGLWERYSPLEVASLSAFIHQPIKFFDWLRPFAKCLMEAKPNQSHYALTTLEKSGKLTSIITQNIDGLHQRAGSIAVIEVHGTLTTLSCCGCYQKFPAEIYIGPYIDYGEIPHCQICGNILKPDVVLYEEQLPFQEWLKAKKAVESCDLLIVAGSSLTVTPVAELPLVALKNQAKIILINLSPTYLDVYSEITIYGDVADIVPEIVSAITDD